MILFYPKVHQRWYRMISYDHRFSMIACSGNVWYYAEVNKRWYDLPRSNKQAPMPQCLLPHTLRESLAINQQWCDHLKLWYHVKVS